MKNTGTLVLFLVSIFIFSSNSVHAAKGHKFTSDEGKMSILFPAAYEMTSDETEGITTVKLTAMVEDQSYLASYTLHEGEITDREMLANVSLEAFAQTTGGTIENESEWKSKKNTGKKADITLPGQDVNIQYYVVLTNSTQYQLVVFGPESGWDQKAAKRFIKSFKISK